MILKIRKKIFLKKISVKNTHTTPFGIVRKAENFTSHPFLLFSHSPRIQFLIKMSTSFRKFEIVRRNCHSSDELNEFLGELTKSYLKWNKEEISCVFGEDFNESRLNES